MRQQFPCAVARDDDGDSAIFSSIGTEDGQNVLVALQHLAQGFVRFLSICLHVDQQRYLFPARVDPPAVLACALAQRVQVQRLQRSVCPDVILIVSHKELAVNKMHVGLDTREAVVQSVVQGARVLIVVVRMGLTQGDGAAGRVERATGSQQHTQKSQAGQQHDHRLVGPLPESCRGVGPYQRQDTLESAAARYQRSDLSVVGSKN